MKFYIVTNTVYGADKPNLYNNLHDAIDCILEIMADYDDGLPYDEQWVATTIRNSEDGEFTWYLDTHAKISYYEYDIGGVLTFEDADAALRRVLGV